MVAEIEVQILDLAGPVAAQRGFDAAANGPAATAFAAGENPGCRTACRGADATIGKTSGEVGQDRSGGVADATARGAEPVELLVESQELERPAAVDAGVVIPHAGALDVGLQADDP
jgi:hypothetical protein